MKTLVLFLYGGNTAK